MLQTCPSSTTLGSGKFHHPCSLRNIYSHFALGLGVYIIGGKPVQSSEACMSGGAALETLTQRRRGFVGLPQFQSWIAMVVSLDFAKAYAAYLLSEYCDLRNAAQLRAGSFGTSKALLCLKIKQSQQFQAIVFMIRLYGLKLDQYEIQWLEVKTNKINTNFLGRSSTICW